MKANSAEVNKRIHEIVRLLSCAKTTHYLIRFCAEEYGVGSRQAESYIARAKAIIKEEYNIERSDFLASRMGILDKVIEQSIRDGQNSNAVGALKLQAQLTQLLTNTN
jgi:hypothetical protein